MAWKICRSMCVKYPISCMNKGLTFFQQFEEICGFFILKVNTPNILLTCIWFGIFIFSVLFASTFSWCPFLLSEYFWSGCWMLLGKATSSSEVLAVSGQSHCPSKSYSKWQSYGYSLPKHYICIDCQYGKRWLGLYFY